MSTTTHPHSQLAEPQTNDPAALAMPVVVPLFAGHPMHRRWPAWTIGTVGDRPAAQTGDYIITAETLGSLDRILHTESPPYPSTQCRCADRSRTSQRSRTYLAPSLQAA